MFKRLSVLWLAVRGDGKRLWFALGHRDTPAWFKAGVVALGLYLVSPVDLIPDVLLVLGIADDLVLVPLALRWLLSRLPDHIREQADAKARGAAGVGDHHKNPSSNNRKNSRFIGS